MIQENKTDKELVEEYPISKFSYKDEKGNVCDVVSSKIFYNDETDEYTYKLDEPNIEKYSELQLSFLRRLLGNVNISVKDDFIEYNNVYTKLKSSYIESDPSSDKRQVILYKEDMVKDINESDIDRITEKSKKCIDDTIEEGFAWTLFKNKIKSLFSEPEDIFPRDIKEEFKYLCIRDILDDTNAQFNIARIVFEDSNITKIELEDKSSIRKNYTPYKSGEEYKIKTINTKIVKVYHKEYGWMDVF